MTPIRIIGAGGFGREVLQLIRDAATESGELRVIGFVDDAALSTCCTLPVTRLEEVDPDPQERFVIAVGDPRVRAELAARAVARGCRFLTVVHPRAHVDATATIGEGAIISPFAFVGPWARIGEHVVMNVFSGADHECVLERFVYLAPHSFVGGGARIGERAMLGMHAGVGPGGMVAAGDRVSAGTHRLSGGV